MMGGFLEKFSGQLAARWTAHLLGPMLFWIGGAIAWMWRVGWTRTAKQLAGLSAEERVVLAVCEVVVLVSSAALAQRLARPVLRFLEGYWHPRVEPLRRRLADRHSRKLARLEQRFQELAVIQDRRELSAPEREEYVRVDCRLRCAPVRPNERMPTQLGNVLRAAESWPANKYGLDAMVCWPRLWLLLPDGAKKDLGEARGELDSGTVAWLWSILFLVWTVWAWWAAPIALVGASLAHVWMLDAAQVYGDLLESAFDVYRGGLYKTLRWDLPTNAAEEREAGRRLTQYLWRGPENPATVLLEVTRG